MNDDTRHDWIAQARETWNSRAERWNERSQANAAAPDRAADIARVWGAMALRPADHVLDAGCGSGQFALALAARGARVTAVDLSPEMIRLARQNALIAGGAGEITWGVGAIDQLSLSDASVAAVHARMVLPFVPDVPAALREFRRVLRPDGRLLTSTAGPLSPIYRESWRRHLDRDQGCNYLLPWELEELLAGGGWRILDGWGEWGADIRGNTNIAADALSSTARQRLQQATATTWTIIAR